MKREEILKVYEEGPEAVVDLVQSLFAIIVRLEERMLFLKPLVKVNELFLDIHIKVQKR